MRLSRSRESLPRVPSVGRPPPAPRARRAGSGPLRPPAASSGADTPSRAAVRCCTPTRLASACYYAAFLATFALFVSLEARRGGQLPDGSAAAQQQRHAVVLSGSAGGAVLQAQAQAQAGGQPAQPPPQSDAGVLRESNPQQQVAAAQDPYEYHPLLRRDGPVFRQRTPSPSPSERPPRPATRPTQAAPPRDAAARLAGGSAATSTGNLMPAVGEPGDMAIQFPPRFPVQHEAELEPEVLRMCEKTLWNTRDTTVTHLPDNTTFVITGDINDLWVRDSCAQVHPYIKFAPREPSLARLLEGLIRKLAFYIQYDPYANAFRVDTLYEFSEAQKAMGRHGYISTWDYELDSGAYFFRLLWTYWKHMPGAAVLRDDAVLKAIDIQLNVWETEQWHEDREAIAPGYHRLYRRPAVRPSEPGHPWTGFAGLPREGKGTPTAHTGMVWSAFRPSDDEQKYGYLVPGNMFAVVGLNYVAELAGSLWRKPELAARAQRLAAEIDEGIRRHAIVQHPQYGMIYAYEVDGLGNHLLMDDANIPSLMSIPYIGYRADPEVYANTKRFILSPDNPTYAESRDGTIRGFGSPHTAAASRNNIWPMGQITQGLASASREEKLDVLRQLVATTGGSGMMHESYDPNNPRRFTRGWFAWANSLFAELVMSLTDKCPASTAS
eukprot:jgi/Tetstr1/442007/TSEL_030188.t1